MTDKKINNQYYVETKYGFEWIRPKKKESSIKVEGKKYRVTENLGYQNGYYVKAVETPDGERIVVRCGSVWTWWTARNRLQIAGPYVGQSVND